MKKLFFFILFSLIVFSVTAQNGTKVTSSIVPNSFLDNYPTHQSSFGKGGYRSVKNLTERDAIFNSRRDTGMLVYVASVDKIYILKGGIANANWDELKLGNPTSTDTVSYTRNGIDITTAGYTYGFRSNGTNTNYTAVINTYDNSGNPVDARFTKANNSITVYPSINCTLDALIVLNSFAPGGGSGGTTVETDPVVKAINGLVKSDGATISAASPGVDYVQPSGLAPYIAYSDTGVNGHVVSRYSANFKNFLQYNDDTIFYLPKQGTSFFEGSMFIGNGGKNLNHVTASQGQRNTGFSKFSLYKITTGNSNSAFGFSSLYELTTGNNNSAFGYETLKLNSTGSSNSAFGIRSLFVNTSGSSNTAQGQASLGGNTTGSQNVAIGISSGLNGNFNNSILIGYRSGYGFTGKGLNQNGLIKIGYLSGQNDTSDNKLFIENSNSQTPLIGGKFDLDQLGTNMTITKPWNFTYNVGGSSGVGYVNTVSMDTVNGLKMAGSATVWEDIDFPIIIRTTGTNIPTISTTQGNLTSPQWAVNDFAVCEKREIPHAAKIGATTYQWHIHLETGGTNVDNRYVAFEIEWNWANNGAAFSVPATISSGDLLIPANTPANTHLVFNIGSPFGLTGQTLGAHIKPRLKRVTSTGTAPTANPFCEMLQIHYERDSEGSSTINSK